MARQRFGDDSPTTDALFRLIEKHTKRLDEMDLAFSTLAEQVATTPPAPAAPPAGEEATPPVSWWTVDDEDQAEEMLRGIGEWQAGVFTHYRPTRIILRSCWPWHPGVVEEFLQAREAQVFAYRDDAMPTEPAAWHDRVARPTWNRVKDLLAECQPYEHYDIRVGEKVEVEITPESVMTYARWWAHKELRDDETVPGIRRKS